MKMKKFIITIISLVLIILPMITMPVQAMTAKVYNLTSEMKGNTVYFSWSKVSNADGYDLYINTENKGYQYIGSVTNNIAPVIGFQEGVNYQAKVCAYEMKNGNKETGSFSDAIKVNTQTKTSLAKVTTLTASQNGGNVTLNWSKVQNAEGYQVFVNISGMGYLNIGSVDGGATSAMITGFENTKSYQFKVRAYKKATSGVLEYGEFSPEKKLTIDKNENENQEPQETKPNKVTNLTVSNVTENSADISWSKVNNADGYEIYLATSNGKYNYMSTVYKNSATIKQLTANTYYKVKVVSFKEGKNGAIYGDESTYKSFTTSKAQVNIDTVKNLKVSVDKNKASLNWGAVSNASGYEIWIKKGTGAYQYTTTIYKNSAIISNLAYNTNYSVKVIAFKDKQYGSYSSEVRFTTPQEEIKVAQVTGLNASVNENTINVNWKSVNNVDGYKVYLSKNNANSYSLVKTTSSTSVVLAGLNYDTTYYIKVNAYKRVNGKNVESSVSAVKKIATQQKSYVATPTGLSATVKNRNEAYLQWKPVTGASGYEIYLATGTGSYTKVDSSVRNYATIYENSNEQLKYNTNYKVKVRAYKYVNNKKVYSEYSNIATFRTQTESVKENNTGVPQVQGLRASVTKNTVTLRWEEVAGAQYYEVYFTVPGLGGGNTYKVYTNSKTISGLTEKSSFYTARVRAYKWVNGKLVAGKYSQIASFTAK